MPLRKCDGSVLGEEGGKNKNKNQTLIVETGTNCIEELVPPLVELLLGQP